jgi:putative endonuclease
MSGRYRRYYVYIMANLARTIYIGMTSNLVARVEQHKRGTLPGFTRRYGLDRLVYYEEYPYVHDAIARERQLKGWLRARKVALIEATNPEWHDLSDGWWEGTDSSPSLCSGSE